MVSANRVGVTVGALLTRVADAGVVELAQQTWSMIEKMNFSPFILLPFSPVKTTKLNVSLYT